MGFRFQKRIRIFKGLTLNLSRLAPLWLRQSVSQQRSSDADGNASGRTSGVPFDLGSCYLCLNGTEYRDLLGVIESCR